MSDSFSGLDIQKILITNHAIERFLQRLRILGEPNLPKDPKKTIKKLLTRAEEYIMGSTDKAIRLMNNGYVPTIYLVNSGFRFVIAKHKVGLTLVTVELIEYHHY